jgi:hypothetical protein
MKLKKGMVFISKSIPKLKSFAKQSANRRDSLLIKSGGSIEKPVEFSGACSQIIPIKPGSIGCKMSQVYRPATL